MKNSDVVNLKNGDILYPIKGRRSSLDVRFKDIESFIFIDSRMDYWSTKYTLIVKIKYIGQDRYATSNDKILADSVTKGEVITEDGYDIFTCN